MAREYINKEDMLNTGREKLNRAIDRAYDSELTAINSKNSSEQALNQSILATQNSNKTQKQLDEIILESGTSDAEVIQARGDEPLLKDRLDNTDNKIDEIKEEDIAKRNNDVPLNLKTYDGSNQATHPSAIHQLFGGYNYWLSCTPYPYTNDDYENPCIYFSQDGISFSDYSNNPIDQPTTEEVANGDYMSDPDILIVDGVMQLFYRFNTGKEEYLLRKISSDGKNWSDREIVYKADAGGSLSPAIVYDINKYRMWYVKNDGTVWYTESTTGKLDSWSEREKVNINFKGDRFIPWHIDVSKIGGNLYLILNASEIGDVNKRHILIGESTSNHLFFDNCQLVLSPRSFLNTSIDNSTLYRASMIHTVVGFRLYYGCMNREQKWSISFVEGPSPYEMRSQNMITNGNILTNQIQTPKITLEDNSYLKKDTLLFRTAGIKAAKIINSAYGEISFTGEDSSELIDLKFKGASLYRTSSSNGKMKFIESGKRSAAIGLSRTEPTTLRVEAENSTGSGALEVNTLYLTGENLTQDPVAGAIRFNASSKKHEGFDGSKWNQLY